eukprot:CAMPEP_0181185572 /NCGR_PEP_ID=MMETSP1096-20121128/9577_1 /TAXON_ID=156174 ORGANISM="Chrysochromulina ericina, Strain CCMP281" /NCGR_SAMPLE_ID=MMETSP1096 /ASSEMBLY_ACC=CAM_ASM_000453 /LENGTH=163 /DNA_ID=CAMNT_0023274421 /DNA_START=348 /DNA_END=836 /DNA_ORIENTATION=-
MMLPPCSLASSFGELSGEVVGVTYGELQLRGMNLGLLKKESTYKQSPSFRMRVPNVVKITEPGRRYLGVPQELNLMMYGPWSSYPQPELRVELVELKLRSDQGICADRGDVHATMSYAPSECEVQKRGNDEHMGVGDAQIGAGVCVGAGRTGSKRWTGVSVRG